MFQEVLARAKAGDQDAAKQIDILAATGCIEAQRACLDDILSAGDDFPTLMRAEVMAQLVAAHGDPEDNRKLASIHWVCALQLKAVGSVELAEQLAQLALTDLGNLADAGHGPANESLADMAAQFPHAWERIGRMPPPQPAAQMVEQPVPIVEVLAFPEPTRRERFGWWLSDVGSSLRGIGWAFADLWRAIRGDY